MNPETDRKSCASQAGNSSRLELPGRLLRSAALVLALGFGAAVVLGFIRADDDVRAEMQSAMAIAQVVAVAQAQTTAPVSDEAALQGLRQALGAAPLRHLRISLRDQDGQVLVAARRAEVPAPWLESLVALQRRWHPQADPPPLVVELPRADRAAWSLVITPDPDSERRESIWALVQSAAVLALASVVMLALLRIQIHRALAPMARLLESLRRMRERFSSRQEPLTLPLMAVRELQAIAEAIEDLDAALQRTERQRRTLSLRMQSLQEDERRRMSQELHDELGQRLMALRLEIAVLQRRVAEQPALAQAVAALGQQVQSAQQEVSDLLRRLAPRADDAQPARRLQELIEDLIQPIGPSPSAQGGAGHEGPQVRADLQLGHAPLSEALLMALYRMSQEALTNARRHAQARHVHLTIRRDGPHWHWRCEDDGIGLNDENAVAFRGNGLAGLRERAWAFGGDLQMRRGAGGGLVLCAQLLQQEAEFGANFVQEGPE